MIPLFFGPLHVLFIYGLKRFGDLWDLDSEVYDEIQRRAASVPPAQRQAFIDQLKANRAQIEREVFLRNQQILRAKRRSEICFWVLYWAAVLLIGYFFGHSRALEFILASIVVIAVRCIFNI